MPLASWYICSGCGPSVRCLVCQATECSQGVAPDTCPGCRRAVEMRGAPMPWNVRTCTYLLKSVVLSDGSTTQYRVRVRIRHRPVRHLRRWYTGMEQHRNSYRYQLVPHPYGRPDRRRQGVKIWEEQFGGWLENNEVTP